MPYWENSLRKRRLRKMSTEEENMSKPMVLQCCYCRNVQKFGEWVEPTRPLWESIMQKHVMVLYKVCPDCKQKHNSGRLLPVDD